MSLSEQELVDCDRAFNEGCNGGLMDYAFKFIIGNGGIDSDQNYPYKGFEGICDPTRVSSLNKTVLLDNTKITMAHSLMTLLIYFELLIDCVIRSNKNLFFSNDVEKSQGSEH